MNDRSAAERRKMGTISGIRTYAANYSVQYSKTTKSNVVGAERRDANQFASALTNRYKNERAERFDRTKMRSKPQQKPSFVGRVFSEEELYQYVDDKVQSNQASNVNSESSQYVKNKKTAEETYVHARAVDTVGIIGKNAPDAVRQAWIEAADETGTNGVSVTLDGKHFHLPQMLVEHLNRTFGGGGSPENILGNSVESAISAAQKAIYDIDNPLPGQPVRSNDVQQEVKKERAFYERFIEKLMNIEEV